MKLATKLVSVLVLGIVLLLAIDGYLSVQREIEIFETDMKHDAHLLGLAMKNLVVDVWRASGQQRALKLIEYANQEEQLVRIRWVWLDAPVDDPYRPRALREQLDPALRGQKVSFKMRDKEGNRYFYTYVPVTVDSERAGAFELTESLSLLDEYTRTTVIRIFVLMGVLMLVSGLAALFLGVGMVGQPLQRLVEKVRRVGTGDLSGPLHLRGRDEFSELAAALNTMCEKLAEAREKVREETAARIAALEQLRHADRLRTVGRLASGVAHELGTPLNVVSGRAGLITTGNLSEAEVVESANIIKAQSERMATIIRQLLDFARRRSPQKASTDLRKLVRETLNLMAPLGKKRKVTLSLSDEDHPVTAEVDAGQIQQVLTNLISNALQAMPRGGKVEVGIRRERVRPPEGHEGSEGEYLCIYVLDEGEGISEENMRHLFEPFFTTRDVGEGTGLGLSIAYGLVHEHGGWIDLKSELGKGSCFSVYLPEEVDGCVDAS